MTGQDGSYLADFLIEKGYIVYGLSRRTANYNFQRLEHLLENPNFKILYGDVTDQSSIINAVETAEPQEFYNLAAQSFVGESWNQPGYTSQATGIGVLNCLEAIRLIKPNTRFYQASSSEMFGKVQETPQIESTPFYPRSPYGVAKAFGHYMTVNYRESHQIFACSGILFNHESPRRGKEFVTRKITDGIARIQKGMTDHLSLGNLDARRDWGDARDYVRAMWLMLQQDKPEDFVIATGETRSVRDFLVAGFKAAGFEDPNAAIKKYIRQDPKFMRPAEVDLLLGDPSKAYKVLGWKPEISFDQMVSDMILSDME